MRCRKYDIVLVNFPFTDLSMAKKRPALIVKSLEGANNILCQITTKARGFKKYEIDLKKKNCEGDIRFDSKIYADVLFTLHEKLILRKIGYVKDSKVIDEIEGKLRVVFD